MPRAGIYLFWFIKYLLILLCALALTANAQESASRHNLLVQFSDADFNKVNTSVSRFVQRYMDMAPVGDVAFKGVRTDLLPMLPVMPPPDPHRGRVRSLPVRRRDAWPATALLLPARRMHRPGRVTRGSATPRRACMGWHGWGTCRQRRPARDRRPCRTVRPMRPSSDPIRLARCTRLPTSVRQRPTAAPPGTTQGAAPTQRSARLPSDRPTSGSRRRRAWRTLLTPYREGATQQPHRNPVTAPQTRGGRPTATRSRVARPRVHTDRSRRHRSTDAHVHEADGSATHRGRRAPADPRSRRLRHTVAVRRSPARRG